MKLTPFIYQPSWMGHLLWQRSKTVTEGEGNRRKDGTVMGAIEGVRCQCFAEREKEEGRRDGGREIEFNVAEN